MAGSIGRIVTPLRRPYRIGMAQPKSGASELLTRVAIGIIVLAAGLIVFQFLLGWIFSLIRVALLLGLLALVAWLVLVGPPGMDERT